MKLLPSVFLTLSVLLPCGSFASEEGRPAKPNFVMILADDLGWQDVKCYDIDEPSPMETPNIDALADRGVMFWQGLLTGTDLRTIAVCNHERQPSSASTENPRGGRWPAGAIQQERIPHDRPVVQWQNAGGRDDSSACAG